jgi:hypothetical protein
MEFHGIRMGFSAMCVKLSEYATRNGIKYRAAWNRYKAGKIEGAYLDDSGHVVVGDPQHARIGKAAVYAASAPISSATIWIVRSSGWPSSRTRQGYRWWLLSRKSLLGWTTPARSWRRLPSPPTHYELTAPESDALRVLARQPVDPTRPHPFTEAGNTELNALLWMPPTGQRAGDIVMVDSTNFTTLFGGTDSLVSFWRNLSLMTLG